jgi:serine O-acetyltransferase
LQNPEKHWKKERKAMKILETIKADYRAVVKNDPAFPGGIRGILEVILCYPGFHAVLAHRLLYFLHARLKVPVLPRFLGQIVRWWTGIEIHPGATVGKGVFIDHGMGVVVGETAVIGDNVTIYQGVTLGATGNERGTKRHPTVAEGAFIGSGARILGNITVGAHARVGAGSVVVKDVPSGATGTSRPKRPMGVPCLKKSKNVWKRWKKKSKISVKSCRKWKENTMWRLSRCLKPIIYK